MKFNARTDFSLRMLMYLSAKRPEKATIQEIARRLGLSQDHLMRIAAELGKGGFLISTCGRGGGLALAKNPSEITVGDVVRAMEPDFALVQCFAGTPHECSLEPACRLKGVLAGALSAFFVELDQSTLQDLVSPNDKALSHALGLSRIPLAASAVSPFR